MHAVPAKTAIFDLLETFLLSRIETAREDIFPLDSKHEFVEVILFKVDSKYRVVT
jgi:hypothetical protein